MNIVMNEYTDELRQKDILERHLFPAMQVQGTNQLCHNIEMD